MTQHIEEIQKIASRLEPQFVAFCQRLIRIPSASGEEKDAANAVMEEMNRLGYEDIFQDAWGNVVGIIRGTKPGPAIMYNGHMDVVTPGSLDEWKGYDPYGAVIDEAAALAWDGKTEEMTEVMHGRGTSDMKTGLCAELYTGGILAAMKRQGMDWKGTFVLAAVVLEENGEMMGTIKLTEGLLTDKKIEIDGMVCAEPSSMRLMLGHRGRMEICVQVHGRSCHGGSPWLGINAAEKAGMFITAMKEAAEHHRKSDEHLGTSGMTLTMMTNHPNALCIVPDLCTLVYDRRLVTGETPESAIAEFQQVIDALAAKDPDFKADVSVNTNVRSAFTGLSDTIASQKDAWEIAQDHPFVQACAAGLEALGEPVEFGYWDFSTDCPQLGTVMGKPVIGYAAGQQAYAHTPVERVRMDYLKRSFRGLAAMYAMISELPKESFHA